MMMCCVRFELWVVKVLLFGWLRKFGFVVFCCIIGVDVL